MSTPVTTTAVTDADKAAIAAVPARMIELWAAHDADAFGDLFTTDGTMILPGVYQKGRDAIRAFMAQAYAGPYKGTNVVGTPIDVKPLAPGAVALITTGGVLAPGETEPTPANVIVASWILVHREGRWQVAVYQNCPRERAA